MVTCVDVEVAESCFNTT